MTAPIFRDFQKVKVTLLLVFLVGIKRKKIRVTCIPSTQKDRKTLQL